MTDLPIHKYAVYSTFVDDWPINDTEETMKSRWQLLGLLDRDEVLIILSEWLADKKVGYVEGATPTEFIGRIERETEKAILLADSTEARPLMRLAHRISELEGGPANSDSRDFINRCLRELRSNFDNSDQFTSLREEWLPKSQIEHIARKSP